MAQHGLIRDALGALPILAVLAAVYLLPPDTSLSEIRRAGALPVCLPPDAPPFVAGDAKAPGIDVEILQALARDLGLRLAPVPEPAMGQDFNPRAWHVTRAACAVLAGGLVASPTTRSFLEMSPPYAQTGWALHHPATRCLARRRGSVCGCARKLGVLAPPSGLDRIALASHLRAEQAQVIIVSSAEALVAGLREGRFEAGVTEKLLADQIAAREHWGADWLPGDLPRYPVAFGLWKGDLTLKRAVAGALERRMRDGTVAGILAKYVGRGSRRAWSAAKYWDRRSPDCAELGIGTVPASTPGHVGSASRRYTLTSSPSTKANKSRKAGSSTPVHHPGGDQRRHDQAEKELNAGQPLPQLRHGGDQEMPAHERRQRQQSQQREPEADLDDRLNEHEGGRRRRVGQERQQEGAREPQHQHAQHDRREAGQDDQHQIEAPVTQRARIDRHPFGPADGEDQRDRAAQQIHVPQRIDAEPPVMLGPGVAQDSRRHREPPTLQGRYQQHRADAHHQLR